MSDFFKTQRKALGCGISRVWRAVARRSHRSGHCGVGVAGADSAERDAAKSDWISLKPRLRIFTRRSFVTNDTISNIVAGISLQHSISCSYYNESLYCLMLFRMYFWRAMRILNMLLTFASLMSHIPPVSAENNLTCFSEAEFCRFCYKPLTHSLST